MPVTDFECQIARGQIGRYLGGGLLSPEAMKGLEEHLAECSTCKALVAERRAALLGMLGGQAPTRAVVSMPVAEENPLIAALRARAEAPVQAEKPKASPRYAGTKAKPVMSKPIVLGGLLAIVLIGMSYMSRSNGGKGVLGNKASESFAAQSLSDSTPAPAVTPIPAEKTPLPKEQPKPIEKVAKTEIKPDLVSAPAAKETPVAKEPLVAPAKIQKAVVAEKPVAPKMKVRRVAKRNKAIHKRTLVRKTKRAKRTPSTSVRIYGLDGQPLKS